jgi:hypothetical protein
MGHMMLLCIAWHQTAPILLGSTAREGTTILQQEWPHSGRVLHRYLFLCTGVKSALDFSEKEGAIRRRLPLCLGRACRGAQRADRGGCQSLGFLPFNGRERQRCCLSPAADPPKRAGSGPEDLPRCLHQQERQLTKHTGDGPKTRREQEQRRHEQDCGQHDSHHQPLRAHSVSTAHTVPDRLSGQ